MTLVAVADHGNSYILAVQIANSSTFQTVVGAANATAALDKIHYPYVDFDESGAVVTDLEPPRCIIVDELGEEEYMGGGGSMHSWMLRESWWVSFDFPIPSDYTSEGGTVNAWAWFQLQVRTILKEVHDLGSTGEPVTGKAYMLISFARRVEGPYRIEFAERRIGTGDGPSETSSPTELWHVAYEIGRGF